MERSLLFFFLVILLPFAVYWASHGFENPIDNAARFASEVSALRGTRPEPERTEPEREPDPEPEPAREPEKDQEPEPEPEPDPEPDDAWARGNRLFFQGSFEEAAQAYRGVDARRRALAQLGAAFVRAFPEDLPDDPYFVVKTGLDQTYEGFAEKRGDTLKLTGPTGRSYTFPNSAVRSSREVPADEVADHIADGVRTEGAGKDVKGKRLFALIQTACLAGRPGAAATLLEKALEVDETEPFFLSSVRNRVPTEHQGELYRAFATCQAPSVMTTVRTPRKLGGNRNGDRQPRHSTPRAKDPKVRELLAQAEPKRRAGERLYKKVVLAGGSDASLDDIEEAIRLLDEATQKYDKAMLIEDSDAVNAALRRCAKLLFSLRFWKQTKEAR